MPGTRRVRSTACAICRQPTAAGDRLCAPCKSALKRARDSTVSEAILPTRRPRQRPATPEPAAEALPALAAPPATWLARGAWAALALGLVVASGVWLAQTRGNAGTIAPRYAVEGAQSGAEMIQAATTTPVPAPTTAPPAKAAPPVETPADEPSRPDLRTLPASITMPRGNGAMVDTPAAPAPVAPAAPPASVVETPLPPPVAVAAPVARPAPDRWQRLAAEIARCQAGDLIARTVCEESLRVEHCDGQWGRVAACPARPERDYGN